MAAPGDFPSVMAELTVFQTVLAKIHANLTNVKNKELLGDTLDRLQVARMDVEAKYPAAMSAIDEAVEEVRAKVTKHRAEVAKRQAEFAQKKAMMDAAMKQGGAIPAAPEAKIDPTLGQKLRSELLQRFSPQAGDGKLGANRIREAWQDWD